jgi:uncharacterized membrane protein (UPF0127 family)
LKFTIRNVTRRTLIGDSISSAETSVERRTGLLKHTHLEEGAGLWIVPCESIHMFFMKFALDVIYLDKKKRVRKVVVNLKPWRISACLSAHSVIELPVGTIERSRTEPGDEFEILTSVINPPAINH